MAAKDEQAKEKASEPQAAAAPVVMMTGEQAARVELATAMKEMAKHPLDRTIPGGKFIVGGKTVNAEGQPIDAKGRVKAADEADEA